MHRCVSIILGSLAVCTLSFGEATAGARYGPGVGFHIAGVSSQNPCAPAGLNNIEDANSSTQTLSTPDGPFYYVYVLGGIEFGIDYSGGFAPAGGLRPIDVFDWTLCASQEFPTAGWPGPGSGNVIIWPIVGCNLPEPDFVFKVAGYLYMGAYDPSSMSVVPHPSSGKAQVSDCQSNVHDVTFPPPLRVHSGHGGLCHAGLGCLPRNTASGGADDMGQAETAGC